MHRGNESPLGSTSAYTIINHRSESPMGGHGGYPMAGVPACRPIASLFRGLLNRIGEGQVCFPSQNDSIEMR